MELELFDYREVLRSEFRNRKALSPKYSLRDFAKNLGLSPAHVSYVLRGMRGLSRRSGRKIANALDLRSMVGRRFCYLISLKSGRSRVERNLAKQALKRWPQSGTHEAILRFCEEKMPWSKQASLLFSRKPLPVYHQLLGRLSACGLVDGT